MINSPAIILFFILPPISSAISLMEIPNSPMSSARASSKTLAPADHHLLPQLYHPHQHHKTLNSHSIAIISTVTISSLLLALGFLLRLLFHRMRSTKYRVSSGSISNREMAKFPSPVSASIVEGADFSPDVRNCLYGRNPCVAPPAKGRGGQVFTYKELQVATGMFSEGNVIGNGGSGVVYGGTLNDGTLAAIKVLKKEGKQGERKFRAEVDLLSRLRSHYLVELLGYCADQHHRILVFEFMANGNLHHHLHPPSGKKYLPLDWSTRLRIALDCARGLEFLHEHSVPAVIHRNFKCSNVLLDQNYRAKLSGFGSATTVSDKSAGQIPSRIRGTPGYMAPECALSGKQTAKSDVYSYGVVLLELLTGRLPADAGRPLGERILVSWAHPRLTNRDKVMEMVDPSLQGQYSKKEVTQIAAIAAVCIQPEADYRPVMTDVVQSLVPLARRQSSISPGTPTKSLQQKITC